MRSFAFLALVFVLAGTAHAQDVYYRFALPAPAVTCGTFQGQPAASTMSTPIEWNAIPPGSSINAYKVLNDTVTLAGNYPIAPGTGSQVFAGITFPAASFPFTAGIRYDTLAAGNVVYESTLLVSCSAVGVPGTSQIVNGAMVLEKTPALSRWAAVALIALVALLGFGATRPRVRHRNVD